ncbi:hypothetical protein GUITHDRAFT_108752 [Guillardia theta CCMP2712]|uniref:Uncharacterized protein n=1 Tax=Guillardia theta (strain CCMP2712) TaxID=905079 RepID=L1JAB8_GUITC|nr:hypothetical protein GUITHDRAFT_108752 [Guillardia theta CCMP2712]EKX45488.1 hypothetical protein GUITHDRAFT_108752 [Guillardia theta CCMP2712]|eukprot:XP_005832468.1 hypothetical protein GUITHDRAFT_108752 [Guillardia theta CCMP2712]
MKTKDKHRPHNRFRSRDGFKPSTMKRRTEMQSSFMKFSLFLVVALCLQTDANEHPQSMPWRSNRHALSTATSCEMRFRSSSEPGVPPRLSHVMQLRGGRRGKDASGRNSKTKHLLADDDDEGEEGLEPVELAGPPPAGGLSDSEEIDQLNVAPPDQSDFLFLLHLPEEVPSGWDPDQDWNLRISSKTWWKEMRERSTFDSLPDAWSKYQHAIRIGAVPWLLEVLSQSNIASLGTNKRMIRWNQTAMHLAAQRGNVKTLQVLLDHGGDIQAKRHRQDGNRMTPLHSAAIYGRTETCKFLIEAGADRNALDVEGYTALDHSIDLKRENTTKLLLEFGRSRTQNGSPTRYGLTGKRSMRVHRDVVKLLIRYKRDPCRDSDDRNSNETDTDELIKQIYAIRYEHPMFAGAEIMEDNDVEEPFMKKKAKKVQQADISSDVETDSWESFEEEMRKNKSLQSDEKIEHEDKQDRKDELSKGWSSD